jgi:hypothetical protein
MWGLLQRGPDIALRFRRATVTIFEAIGPPMAEPAFRYAGKPAALRPLSPVMTLTPDAEPEQPGKSAVRDLL